MRRRYSFPHTSALHTQPPPLSGVPPEQCICYYWGPGMDTSLSPRVSAVHEGSLLGSQIPEAWTKVQCHVPSIHAERLPCPQNPLCSVHPPLPPSASGCRRSRHCLQSFVFSGSHRTGVMQRGAFSDGLIERNNVRLSFLRVFSWLWWLISSWC